MKKTSTRLASIGGLLLLGACAIALAQHDSRNRERSPVRPPEFATQTAEPIEFQGEDPSSRYASSAVPAPTVRANNDAFGSYTALSPDGGPPLPGSASASLSDLPQPQLPSTLPVASEASALPQNQSVETRSPARLPASLVAAQVNSETSTPPAWLQGSASPSAPPPVPSGLPDASALPQLPSGAPAGLPPAMAQAAEEPSLPSAELGIPQGQPSQAVPPVSTSGGLPAAPALSSSPGSRGAPANSMGSSAGGEARSIADMQSGVHSRASDMSDTQRGVMQATDLTAAPNGQGQVSPNGGYPSLSRPLPQGTQAATSSSRANPRNSFANAQDEHLESQSRNQSRLPGAAGNAVAGAGRPQVTSRAGMASSAVGAGYGETRGSGTLTRLAGLISSEPGNRFLDGLQNPVLNIVKRAPDEIQVGKKVTFVIEVENSGKIPAHGVRVLDSVPRGVKFVDSVPSAQPNSQGVLAWDLDEIAPGEKRTISLQMIPEIQGEIGSVATVQFAAQASMRTIATLPKLELDLQATNDVLLGDMQEIAVTVRNTGTGVARDVRLEADIPQELRHESGDAHLDAVVGDLRPNESRTTKLLCAAVQPGTSQCMIRAIAEDGIQADGTQPIEVRAPKLVAAISGPKVRYLERQATYRIAVQNSGTANASNLEFQVHLPAGLKFNAADVHGQYDPGTHTVTWGLHELPVGQTAPIEVTVLPVSLGPQALTFSATGDLGIKVEAKGEVQVKGLSELAFTVGQDDGTIEIGSVSTYSVQVTNVGNESDRNVQLTVELPKGAKLISVVNSPVEYREQGNQIVFAPIAEMRNRDQYTYRFQVEHSQAGRQIVRSKLTSETWPQAVVKEEGTLVYNDQN